MTKRQKILSVPVAGLLALLALYMLFAAGFFGRKSVSNASNLQRSHLTKPTSTAKATPILFAKALQT
jgi:hypothetical protein